VLEAGPVVDGDVDAEDEVEQEQGDEEEVEGGIVTGVVFQVLRGGHSGPLRLVLSAGLSISSDFFLIMVRRRWFLVFYCVFEGCFEKKRFIGVVNLW